MTTDVILRSARTSEKEALEALQWRASLNNPGDREVLLKHPDAIEIPPAQFADGLVFVAECAGAVLGFAAIVVRDDGDSELDALFVEPGHWRRGYGKALLLHCAEAARHRGSAGLRVVGNPHAEAFYLACGFELVAAEQTRFGAGVLMRKGL